MVARYFVSAAAHLSTTAMGERVVDGIHLTHVAGADRGKDFVRTEAGSRGEGRELSGREQILQ